MPIHIGQIIKQLVEDKRLTQKEFGRKINKHEKTVPDIYNRPAISTDLLLIISAALNEDLFKLYYEDEPLKSLRNDEIIKLKDEIKRLNDTIEQLKRELNTKQELIDTQKGYLSVVNEQMAEYKTRKKDQPDNPQK